MHRGMKTTTEYSKPLADLQISMLQSSSQTAITLKDHLGSVCVISVSSTMVCVIFSSHMRCR